MLLAERQHMRAIGINNPFGGMPSGFNILASFEPDHYAALHCRELTVITFHTHYGVQMHQAFFFREELIIVFRGITAFRFQDGSI